MLPRVMEQPKRSKICFKDTGIEHDPIEEIETTSVGDLIDFLSQFPRDICVLAHWEAQRKPFGNAVIEEDEKGNLVLVIDVEGDCDFFHKLLLYPQGIE